MEITEKTLQQAIIFATEKHKDQYRKGDKRPYILHPLEVVITLGQIKKSKNQFLLATAAVLHDVVEDTDVTLEDIAKEFGHHVAGIVEELTSDKEKIAKVGKPEYLLEKMLQMSSYSLCIKLVDRLVNLKDMESMSADFKKKSVGQTQFIIDGLEVGRKLTRTHKKLIKLIRKQL